MSFLTAKKRRSSALVAACAAALSVAAVTHVTAKDGARDVAWPSQVSARYRLSFNGLDVGTYEFVSRSNGKTYTAKGKAEVSALFGAFKWTGTFVGTGTVVGGVPRPTDYEMINNTKSKTSTVKMGFDGTRVASIALQPNRPPAPEAVKLRPQDLQNVLDPMAATMAMSDAKSSNACNRTIPVFDGKARFDLRLSLKGRQSISEEHASGQPRELVVCRVKYVPIAGHKPKDFVSPWIDYNRIEITLRAIPSAGIFIPYRITVPSTIGPAVMDVDTIDITSADNEQIALRQ